MQEDVSLPKSVGPENHARWVFHRLMYLRWLFGAVAVGLLAYTGVGCRGRQPVATKADVVRLMQEYNKEHRYDDGIRVASDWLRTEPNDADMHVLITMFYLEKAASDNARRKELIDDAVRHTDEAIRLAPDSLGYLPMAPTAYEQAGDLSATNRCESYKKAVQVIEHAEALGLAESKKSSVNLNMNWEEVRRMNEATRARITQKMVGAGCQ